MNSSTYSPSRLLVPDSFRVVIQGQAVTLRPLERKLIGLLQRTPNYPVATEILIAELYGNIAFIPGRIRLRRLICDIRQRLGPEFARRLQTVHKTGVVLIDE